MYFPVKPGVIVPSSITGVVVVSVIFRTGCTENDDVVEHDGRGVERSRERLSLMMGRLES